jgi:Holliday junction DNA helicase RuvA
MIARLAGTLIYQQPPLMVIDVAGVGYEVEAPLSVFYDLPEIGQPIVILTHLSIKDDSHTLYGFSSEAERTLFRQLLKISGIGAKLAPGIGKKTAERIIIELRDKLDVLPVAATPVATGGEAVPANASSEAITALNALGYKPQESSSLVRKVAKPDMDVEEIIRLALQSMVKS